MDFRQLASFRRQSIWLTCRASQFGTRALIKPFPVISEKGVMAKAPYNLNYRFGTSLRAIAEDPESMQAYVDFMWREIKNDPPPPPRAMVKFLGDVGAYSIVLKKTEAAIQALQRSLALIDEHSLPISTWAVHTIRYGDALCLKKDFLAAETAFRSVLEMASRNPSLRDLEDFCWQHWGKLKFDEGDLPAAKELLEKALVRRQTKGVPELIASTEYALRILEMKKQAK